jgi:MazG family protein
VSDARRLLEIMARLRDPEGGCPWDLEQRFETISPYTIEEAYEVDDAIRRGDLAALREELGDLLLQVVFHARMAEEAGAFDFGDVVDAICDKLVRRHPHVFGEARIETARDQSEAWERHKEHERARRGEASAADGVPRGLPALSRARKLLSRAARAGVPWPSAQGACEAVAGALDALRRGGGPREEGIGELLLATALLARATEVEPEDALRGALARFEERLRDAEARLAAEGSSLRDAEPAELLPIRAGEPARRRSRDSEPV